MKEREMTEQEIAEQESKAYKTLDVPMDASESDIKRAYRVLARKYHPDKNPNDPTAAEKFTEIQNAYDILSNKKITTDLAFEIADAIHEIAYEEKLFLIQPDSNDKFDADDQLLRETLISDILLLLSKYDISPSSVKELLEKMSDSQLTLYFQMVKQKNESDTFKSPIDLNFEKNPNSVTDYPSSVRRSEFPYELLLDNEIIEKINEAKTNYLDENILDYKLESAFIWLATKPGCAPIYLISTCHLLALNVENYFGEILAKVLSEIQAIYTEINVSSLPLYIEIPYQSGLKKCFDHEGLINKISAELNVTLKHLETNFTRKHCVTEGEEDPESKLDLDYQRLKLNTENFLKYVDFSKASNVDVPESTKKLAKNAIVRNKFWMGMMLKESEENNVASGYAVGAYHNAGKYGLPNLLKNKGYDLKPLLRVGEVYNKKEIIKNFVFPKKHQGLFNKPAQSNQNKEEKVKAQIKPSGKR